MTYSARLLISGALWKPLKSNSLAALPSAGRFRRFRFVVDGDDNFSARARRILGRLSGDLRAWWRRRMLIDVDPSYPGSDGKGSGLHGQRALGCDELQQ